MRGLRLFWLLDEGECLVHHTKETRPPTGFEEDEVHLDRNRRPRERRRTLRKTLRGRSEESKEEESAERLRLKDGDGSDTRQQFEGASKQAFETPELQVQDQGGN